MDARLKKELIFGVISIAIISILIVFRVIHYENQKAGLSNLPSNISADPNLILTNAEIAKHNAPADCWLLIENKVYVATDFLSRHPGGAGLITPYCGADATQPFLTKDGRGSHSAEAFRILGLIYIGDLNGKVVKQPDSNAVKSLQVGGDDD